LYDEKVNQKGRFVNIVLVTTSLVLSGAEGLSGCNKNAFVASSMQPKSMRVFGFAVRLAARGNLGQLSILYLYKSVQPLWGWQ
jgi:hypothetical protein